MKSEFPWDKTYNTPVKGQTFLCKVFESAFRLALAPHIEEDELLTEYFQDGETLTVKLRQKWNEWLENISLEDLTALLLKIRLILDQEGFKTAKVQSSIHLHPNYKEKTNIRIVYNPHWRRYEAYEIFFRSKTQSSRKHREAPKKA